MNNLYRSMKLLSILIRNAGIYSDIWSDGNIKITVRGPKWIGSRGRASMDKAFEVKIASDTKTFWDGSFTALRRTLPELYSYVLELPNVAKVYKKRALNPNEYIR